MTISKAIETDFLSVRCFYHAVIDKMQGTANDIGWKKDLYPDPGFLKESIRNGELYICSEEGTIIASMVLNQKYPDVYKTVSWRSGADESGILVIHILGVHPDKCRNGYGTAMVREAVRLAASRGLSAVRLDVLSGNLPAENLYKNEGFSFIDSRMVYYKDVGRVNMHLYEFVI